LNAKTAKRLRALCIATSTGDPIAAEARYQHLKRGWDATPTPARHALMTQLEKAAALMQGIRERAAAAGRAASAEAQKSA
jgi:hypothetical protein